MTDLYFAYSRGDILLTTEGNVPSGVVPLKFEPWERVTTVSAGEWRCHVFRMDAPVTDAEGLQMVGLRQSFKMLSAEMYRLAGKCAELVYWDQNSRYCGVCGAPMQWATEISKHCTQCGKELWPQLQTAVIVRVTRDEELLMVHARNFHGRHFGLVAGFVETGETLEDCVRREVREETGLSIKNLRYFGSQPWPYPAGLMVGFTAEYDGGELRLQRTELTDGGWFTRDNLPELPDQASIARALIDNWLERLETLSPSEVEGVARSDGGV